MKSRYYSTKEHLRKLRRRKVHKSYSCLDGKWRPYLGLSGKTRGFRANWAEGRGESWDGDGEEKLLIFEKRPTSAMLVAGAIAVMKAVWCHLPAPLFFLKSLSPFPPPSSPQSSVLSLSKRDRQPGQGGEEGRKGLRRRSLKRKERRRVTRSFFLSLLFFGGGNRITVRAATYSTTVHRGRVAASAV